MTSHPLFMISHHAMTFTYTVFMSSTQYTCHHIHTSRAISYSLLIRARLQYVWYETIICMASYEFYVISQPVLLTSKDCIPDITSTIFLNTDPLYTTWHTLHLWHHSQCNYDKTLQSFWHDTQFIWDLTRWMNDNTKTVSDMIPNVSV